MTTIGILQGRLSPPPIGRPQAFPWATWPDEFSLARDCGFEQLEWLVTADRVAANPIWSDAGLAAIRERMAATGVAVTSLCADCFIGRPFVRVPEADRRASAELLERLIGQCARVGIGVVLVPLLEDGAIRDDRERAAVLDALRPATALAAALGVRIGLETDLPAQAVGELLGQAAAPALGAYYDTGNAVAIGADVVADLQALGAALVGIHIKDRRRGGPSVPLGQGEVPFAAMFAAAAAVGYHGPFILETPAGHDPAAAARAQLAFVRSQI